MTDRLTARLLWDDMESDGEHDSPVGLREYWVHRVRMTARGDLMAVSYDRFDLDHRAWSASPQVSWFASGRWSSADLAVDAVWPLDVLPYGALRAVVVGHDDDLWRAEVVAVHDVGYPERTRLLYERHRIRSVRSGSRVWIPAGTVWDGPDVVDAAADGASGVWLVLSGPDGHRLSRWGADGEEPLSVPLPRGVEVLNLAPLTDGVRVVARGRGDERRYVLDIDPEGGVRRAIGLGEARPGSAVAIGADRLLLAGGSGVAIAEVRPVGPLTGAAPGAFPIGYHADPRPIDVEPPRLRAIDAVDSRLYLIDAGGDDLSFESLYVIDLADPAQVPPPDGA